ncbi:hypothetical protein PPL_01600 [Heterostelium album PN500]|uniref:Uncharacterized protein n=1 Tax=Heterostelium pallidum (strain ATCC 26659 / Pp 5 / PN500) TaxID=670386 RepID=D3AZY6_HETP5|nr:hypothetical protein PPL_01600 [Heterostelium album PN500]EFA84610.1 hypothetical protein PPL_01600 [Heterostelium album PN500]|eukprot:XP_020436723.1 hypothetical protein PPL_01600 [Heterostelium album PN500]
MKWNKLQNKYHSTTTITMNSILQKLSVEFNGSYGSEILVYLKSYIANITAAPVDGGFIYFEGCYFDGWEENNLLLYSNNKKNLCENWAINSRQKSYCIVAPGAGKNISFYMTEKDGVTKMTEYFFSYEPPIIETVSLANNNYTKDILLYL